MRVITYLGFTLLSILIQFSVMDYIQDKMKLEEEQTDLNVASRKKRFDEMLKSFKQKPHALYYRTHIDSKGALKLTPSTITYSNISVPVTEISTMITNTIIEEFYDENTSTTEEAFTTETQYTTTEIDNITEITFYDKKNKSIVKPDIPKINLRSKNCGCDLLYKVCDISCCCDNDCTDKDKKLFSNCNISNSNKGESQYLCYPFEISRRVDKTDLFDNLFCIVKTNIPDKRNLNYDKYDVSAADTAFKWHKNDISSHTEFERKPYAYGDTIWVLKENSIWYIDMPSPTVNNYCSGRRPILFLKEQSIACSVHLKDLEMLQIFKTSQESYCISVTEKSFESSALNCSSLHCTNWTIIICDEDGSKCADYNKTIHEPFCNESYCTNIALHLEYTFYYYDSKITNVTIKFFVKNIQNHIPFMTQVIDVRFVMANISIDQIIKVSGNPGYIYGLPIISSTAEGNHTINFLNSTLTKKYLTQINNNGGLCVTFNGTNNFVKFGINKRLKCRYFYNKPIWSKSNSTDVCEEIESNIKRLAGLSETIFISALGNPMKNKESDWLLIKNNVEEKDFTYGQFLAKNSRLRCYNLIVRFSYLFTFADVSEVFTKREDKIIAVKIEVATQNVTFSTDDVSTVLTIDTNFIDGTKPKAYEYAGGPHLNIHLPNDFFYPFPSNANCSSKLSVSLILCITIYYQIK
ncbi:unnamed protein product [Diatraea saccharalis]|uniref:Tectonic-1 n=1 Tax=Diatraea saccharalis TaxID=40085 RepID=A0A9N9QVV6_9NEOP|nr:unnamed protein product [Diatraea saccharalis]